MTESIKVNIGLVPSDKCDPEKGIYDGKDKYEYPDVIWDVTDKVEVYRKGKNKGLLPSNKNKWNSKVHQDFVIYYFLMVGKNMVGTSTDAQIDRIRAVYFSMHEE